MSGINDLPADDLWPIIFKNLSIQDLITCRLVNKKFKKFISSANLINKLIIGQLNYNNDDLYWYYNNTPIKDEDIISLKCFRSIKSRSIFNLDKYLKYLKINDKEFELEELSNLINLESLEFGSLQLGEKFNYNQQIIHSNNLKVIVCNSIDLSIQLNESKLEKIHFHNMNRIKLNGNPESIKHIVTRNYDNRLEIFKNLEIMELEDISINENLLIIFKYLKQLKINLTHSDISYEIIKRNNLIKNLYDKMQLKRELDIYLEGKINLKINLI